MSNALQRFQPLTPETVSALSEASNRAVSAFGSSQTDGGNVAVALSVAESIADLRVMFERPEIKQRILALQDSAIGFRTDRDPKVVSKKTGTANVPYEWETVRDVAIEASLRGLQLVGNQVNILAGRAYVTKEGFEYLIKKVPGLSDWRPVIGIPRGGTGGAFVECSATWKLNGVAAEAKATIPVKTDEYSSIEQTIGKATRKFLKRCFEQMTGLSTPDGDAAEESTPTTAAHSAPVFRDSPTRAAAASGDQIPGAEVSPITAPAMGSTPRRVATAPTAPAPAPAPQVSEPTPAPAASGRTAEDSKEAAELVGVIAKNAAKSTPPIVESELCVTIAEMAAIQGEPPADLIALSERVPVPMVRAWVRGWKSVEALHKKRVGTAA